MGFLRLELIEKQWTPVSSLCGAVRFPNPLATGHSWQLGNLTNVEQLGTCLIPLWSTRNKVGLTKEWTRATCNVTFEFQFVTFFRERSHVLVNTMGVGCQPKPNIQVKISIQALLCYIAFEAILNICCGCDIGQKPGFKTESDISSFFVCWMWWSLQ